MNEFLLFADKYRNQLVNHAFYRLGNLEDAEDIVQDVFVKIYTQKLSLEPENPSSYLYKMTMNACLDFMRKQKSKLRMLQHVESENPSGPENEAIKHLEMEDEFIRMNKMLKILPEEQAEIVRFRIIDGLSFKEITEILDEPESTIKSRFQYAIKKLRTYEL